MYTTLELTKCYVTNSVKAMYSRLRVVPICLLEVQTFYREFTFTQNNKIGAKKFIQTHFEGTKCEFQESSLSFFISFF